MNEFQRKIRSINFGLPTRRQPKITVERDSKLAAKTVEHWDDRQDVELRPKTIRLKGPDAEVVNG